MVPEYWWCNNPKVDPWIWREIIARSYSQISTLSRKNPVAITVNGKEDTVVISHDDFVEQQKYISELEAKLSVYNHLAQATDDLKLGRVQNVDEAFDDI